MDKRIKHLIDNDFFINYDIDKLGRGTFIPNKIETKTNELLSKAKLLKKEADDEMKKDKVSGIKKYIEVIFLYIQENLEETGASTVDKIIKWKKISTFIISILKMLEKSEKEFIKCLEFLLFNIKSHYLFLESSLMIKNPREGAERESNMMYFLKEYRIVYELGSKHSGKFCILEMKNIEQYMKDNDFIM